MERLWTPWRMEFVKGADGEQPGCFLCNKPKEDNDTENLLLYRGERAYALLNLYPYNTAHTLVAPYTHGGDYGELDPATAAEIAAIAQRVVRAVQAEYRPEGFNTGMNLGRVAGAGMPDHLHLHIVPRWGGDTNFMPLVGGTKVMPETLDQTYTRVRSALDARR